MYKNTSKIKENQTFCTYQHKLRIEPLYYIIFAYIIQVKIN